MKEILYAFGLVLLSLPLSCEHRPSAVELRKAEIRHDDSLALEQARQNLVWADSMVTFKAFEVEDMKKQFVFEKQEEYQTVGYYVLPSYAGSKARFTLFPEVEESGKLLLVSIDRQRHYTFTEVNLADEDYTAQLPSGLSSAMRQDIDRCQALAKAMQNLEALKVQQDKLKQEVRFYEEKRRKTGL